LATLLAALLIGAFTWSAANAKPRGVELAVVAPDPAAAQITAALAAAVPGGFDVIRAADAAAARDLIAQRRAYGAIVLGQEGATLITAPAASPAIAQALRTMPERIAAATAASASAGSGAVPGSEPTSPLADAVVEEAAPLPEGDSTGAAFGILVFPLVIVSLLTGAATALASRTRRAAAGTVAVASAGIGLVVAWLGGTWLGVLTGGFWAVAGTVALAVAAIGLTLVGLRRAIGLPGIALGALLVFAIGNPFSGAATSAAMVPAGWAELGQALPPGALATALRSVSYFGGAGAAGSLWTLAAWAAGGALLLWLAPGPRRRGVG
jgi:hypothetical protein